MLLRIRDFGSSGEYSFYKLLPVISDGTQLTYYRMSCVEALKTMPDTGRFRKAVPVMDELIRKEKARSAKDDRYRDALTMSLEELKGLISGGRCRPALFCGE